MINRKMLINQNLLNVRKEKRDKYLVVKIATIDEIKQSSFKECFEAENK